MSTFILLEIIFMVKNLKLYFEMSSVSFDLFQSSCRLEVEYLSFSIIGRYFYVVVGVTLIFAMLYALPSSISGLNFSIQALLITPCIMVIIKKLCKLKIISKIATKQAKTGSGCPMASLANSINPIQSTSKKLYCYFTLGCFSQRSFAASYHKPHKR